MTLDELCTYIDGHVSMQLAEILETECYTVNAGLVTHRFLVLKLCRVGRKEVFLRLDRRRGADTSVLSFLLTAGVTDANDTVWTHSIAVVKR